MVGVLELEFAGGGIDVVLGVGAEDEDEGLMLIPVVVLSSVALMTYDAEVDVVDDKLMLDTLEEVPVVARGEDNEIVELDVHPISAPFVNDRLVVLVIVPAGVELELEDPTSPSASVLLYTVTIMTSPSFSVVNCRFSFSRANEMERDGRGTMAMPPHFWDGFPGQVVLHAESGYLI